MSNDILISVTPTVFPSRDFFQATFTVIARRGRLASRHAFTVSRLTGVPLKSSCISESLLESIS